MTTPKNTHHLEPRRDLSGLEGRLGLRLTAALSEHSSRSEADIAERLRFARERALQIAQQTRHESRAKPLPKTLRGLPVGLLQLASGRLWLDRCYAAVPAVMLCCGLYMVDQWHDTDRAVATVEVDAALLSDALPPEAYEDPGFSEFLRMTESD